MRIERVVAREVLDSRGKPTVECELHTADGAMGRAIAPSGASTGSAEARELRDGDRARYDGDGVLHAVENIRRAIGPKIIGLDPRDQSALDGRLLELDPSPQKSTLGGNAILAVSLAAAHLAAAVKRQPLYLHLAELWGRDAPRMPLPMVNMISGGKHAGGNLDFQDILIQPIGAPSFRIGLEWIVRVYRRLGRLLQQSGYEGYLVGDEGGFGPRLRSNREAVETVVRAIESADLRPGVDINLAIDVAATQFYHEGRYVLRAEGGRTLTADEMIERLAEWVDEFPIASVEDGLAEEDWSGWERLTARLGHRVKLVGDDLFATNVTRVQRGVSTGAANAVLVKMNQIGTLTETLQTMHAARRAGFACVVSARSGETEDTTMADLATATAAESIKIGSIVRSERLAKYNQLLRLEELMEG